MSTILILASLATAQASTFSESQSYGSFLIPLDGSDVVVSTVIDVSDLDPYVGGRLDVESATLDLTFYDLDVDPDVTTTNLGNGCICTTTLTEVGEVEIDGIYVGDVTEGADNDYATTSIDLDTDVLAEIEADGEVLLDITLWAEFDNPCGLSVGNAYESLTDITLSGEFDENHAPVASAYAEDAEADDSCSAAVELDGSGSSDEDSSGGTNDDIVSFEWDIDGDGNTDLTGETVSADLGVGTHDVTLTVTDSYGESSSETIEVTVTETAIEWNATVSPEELTPADHTLRDIEYDLTGTYVCSGDSVDDAVWALVDVTSDESDDAPGPADGATTGDIDLAATGELQLRAERSWRGDGRVYTLEFEVYGEGGAVTDTAEAEVTVPLSASGCSSTSSNGAAGGILAGLVGLLGLAIRRRRD